MTRKARPARKLRRRRPFIEPREAVLIVCEGEKTEPNYFNALWRQLRAPTVEVEVVGRGATPITVVNEAVERRKQRKLDVKAGGARLEFDQVWCVFDVEQLGRNESLPRALDKARGNRLSVALSNPCFEYWYLLHFERTGSAFLDCSPVIQALRKHLPGYRKGGDVFAKVYSHTENAIERARGVDRDQWHQEDDLVKRNPSTQVYKLVEELRRISTRPYLA